MSSRPSPINVHADSSILMFPPCHDYRPAILPLLACSLDLPCPLLSLWQLLIQMAAE